MLLAEDVLFLPVATVFETGLQDATFMSLNANRRAYALDSLDEPDGEDSCDAWRGLHRAVVFCILSQSFSDFAGQSA